MARAAREKSRSGIYHIMLRGINRQIIFEDDEDKDMFLTTLESFKGNNNYNLYGYCLMTNHIHILMKELDDEISTAIKRICASYVFWYNRKYERCGHLFHRDKRYRVHPDFCRNLKRIPKEKSLGILFLLHKTNRSKRYRVPPDFCRNLRTR